MTNEKLVSVTAETSQDPIGPCGVVPQVRDIFMHCAMPAFSSALDFGAHAVMNYFNRGYTVRLRARVRIMIRVRVGVRGVGLGSGNQLEDYF